MCHAPSNHRLLCWEGGQCCLAAFLFRGSHHIAAKVEEGDVPDHAQHELNALVLLEKGLFVY